MNPFRMFPSLFLAVVLTAPAALASPATTLGNNAALRYWAAFSAMQDSDISAQDAKELNTILAGTAPYDDSKYRTLVEKNRLALKIMARGTRLRTCDWGLDYTMGEDLPVEYARKALALGRLNVLYSFHLLITGDKEGAADTLAAGLRFSQDVARGGSLFATLAAKDLLDSHFRAIAFALHVAGLSDAQKDELRKAAAQLGPEPLDWTSAAKRDLEGLRGRFANDAQASAALTRITSAYLAALNDPSRLAALQETMHQAPKPVSELIPNGARVLQEKQELAGALAQARSLLR